ncbi:hypothetical protein H920_11761 [Fukomys damarensis]|uniref:Uncharacterized protein n=1 Tax=Fukomys damarensis TaxID=885580 RepID=A0A091DVP3_FUKDA|nr:hypothetical protein H920_11761 [Fukomys damarensis]
MREPPSPADSHPGFMQGMKSPETMARDISPFLKITRAQEEPVNHPGRKVVEAGIPYLALGAASSALIRALLLDCFQTYTFNHIAFRRSA